MTIGASAKSLGPNPRRATKARVNLQDIRLDAVPAALIATDLDGEIIYWNRYAEELYGWLTTEVIGRNIMEFTVAPETEQQAEEIMSLVRAGQSWTGEFRVRRSDGTFLSALVTDSPLIDEDGVLIGIIGISHDLSARKQAEEAYKQAQKELEFRVQQRTQELKCANEHLRQLTGRLLQLQDEERRRIARELHDSVGQLLVGIDLNLELVKAESHKLRTATANAVSQSSSMVSEILAEIRTISHLLHPPLLDEAGLVSALTWYTEGYSERSKIAVSLNLPPDLGRLSKELELTIFRVVQEGLTNIHRHSESTRAEIRLTLDHSYLFLEIKDAGKGISQKQQTSMNTSGGGGVGLRGIKERLAQLGGHLRIESNNNGTILIVTLPLQTSAANKQVA